MTHAGAQNEGATLKKKDHGELSPQKEDVTIVANPKEIVMEHTHLLKHAAHAKHIGGYAPLRNQKKDCRKTKDANAVLHTG